jgi:beta-phosphoglucomutase
MIKAIVWDFDGVIVDSEPLHYRAFLRVAKGFGFDFTWDDYVEKFIGYDDRDAFRIMLGRPPEPTPDEDLDHLAKLCDEKALAFEAVVNKCIEPIPGSITLIDQAAQTGMTQAIASGATRRDIELILDKLNLASRFTLVVSADDVARSKPDPQTYRLACEGLGIASNACLSIEDTPAGITSARGAGLWSVALNSSATDSSQLHQAHRMVETLEGLTVEQLQEWFGQ